MRIHLPIGTHPDAGSRNTGLPKSDVWLHSRVSGTTAGWDLNDIADLERCASGHLCAYMDPGGAFAFNTYVRLYNSSGMLTPLDGFAPNLLSLSLRRRRSPRRSECSTRPPRTSRVSSIWPPSTTSRCG
jgi:hypothetical protein